MNGAETLLTMLRDYEVEVIFGVPGDTNVALYSALKTCPAAPRHIMCRDERSALYMAECYARLSGKPGVAEVPSGAGALYALPGVAEATQSSVPIILLVNDIPRSGNGRGTLTELPVVSLFKPISKHVEALNQIEKLPETVRRAFRQATGGCPGAVVLCLPEDLLFEEVQKTLPTTIEPTCKHAPSNRAVPEIGVLQEALDAILKAQRPVIVSGGGANRSQAGRAISAFAERLEIPVVSTITGQGILPDDHELAIGIIGDNGYHPHAIWTVENADLVLFAGCRMGSVATRNWTTPSPSPDKVFIQIEIEPARLGNTYALDHALTGDVRAVFESLANLVTAEASPKTSWAEAVNEQRSEFWAKAAKTRLPRPATGPMTPRTIIEALNRHLPARTNVISDAGTPTPYASRYLKLNDPASRLVIPRFYGGLGYAIPGVVGAHLACPDMQTVGLFGDGSLGMSAGELETLARLNVPVVLLHFNNACFGWIKALQRLTHKERARRAGTDATANDPSFSVDFGAYDMSRLADVYGIANFRVQNLDELDAALTKAFAMNEPVFLDIVVESIADQLPPVRSWERMAGHRENLCAPI